MARQGLFANTMGTEAAQRRAELAKERQAYLEGNIYSDPLVNIAAQSQRGMRQAFRDIGQGAATSMLGDQAYQDPILKDALKRDKDRKELMEMFSNADTDGDGNTSEAEYQAVANEMKARGYFAEAEKVLDEMRKDVQLKLTKESAGRANKQEQRKQEEHIRAGEIYEYNKSLRPEQKRLVQANVKKAEALAEKYIADAKAKPGGGDHFQKGGMYINEKTGQPVGTGVFDKRTGVTKIQTPDGSELIDMPPGSIAVNKSALQQTIMSPNDFKKLHLDVITDKMSIDSLIKYMSKVKGTKQGLGLLIDQFQATAKTFFNKNNITAGEIATLEQDGRLQGLLGKFRNEVVGGGVMTEQDALRVLSALGGDLSSTRNKQVAANLLRDIVEQKKKSLAFNLKHYNAQLSKGLSGRSADFDKIEMPEFDMSVFNVSAPPKDAGYQQANDGEWYRRDENGNIYKWTGKQ